MESPFFSNRRDSLRLLTAALAAAVVLAGPFSLFASGAAPAPRATRLQPRYAAPGGPSADPLAGVAAETGLDLARARALADLFGRLDRGAEFTAEEGDLLRTFAARRPVSRLEADLVISRALFARDTAGASLTAEQRSLLDEHADLRERVERERAERKARLRALEAEAERDGLAREALAPPANDTCAGAVTIPASGPFPYVTPVTPDITEATAAGDPPAPSCEPSVSRSIWYAFTPAATGLYTLSVCSGAPTATTVTDTVMAVYTSASGCAGPFTELPSSATTLGCDDDSCASQTLQSVITTQLTMGTTYYVVVWKSGATAPLAGATAVQLRVSRTTLGASDNCASASALTLNVPVTGSLVGADDDYLLSSPACFTGTGNTPSSAEGRDVVYSFTAPSAGNYSFRVTNFVPEDETNLVVYVATSCPAAVPDTPVTVTGCLGAANRNLASTSETVSCVALTAGQQVSVYVDENFRLTAPVTFTLEVTACTGETESNDTTGTADPLACGVEGSISPAGDVDFYSLGMPAAGSRVFAMIDATGANIDDFDLRVTTATDTLEYDEGDNDAAFGSNAPNIAGLSLTGAASFLRVNYLNPATESGPYRLYSVVQPPIAQATPEAEPNDTLATASQATNNYFTGTLALPEPSPDVDYYAFNASAGDLIFVSLDADPERTNTPLDAAITLLDANGTPVASANNEPRGTITDPSPGTLTGTTPSGPGEALVYRAPTSGAYYVCVMVGSQQMTSLGAGNYLLSISKNCQLGGGGGVTPGAGTDTVGIFVPSTGAWFLRNSNTQGAADLTFFYGAANSGFVELSGDWDGDGDDTPGLYDPATGFFFLRNSNTSGPADLTFQFGVGGANIRPIAGDWDGDGDDTVGIYNTTNGTFFLRNSNTSGPADVTFVFGVGGATILPVTGDFDGDGDDTVGLYNTANGTFFLKNTNTSGPADVTFNFGVGGATILPLFGDYDGDGDDTVGLYNSANGSWFLKNANAGGAADLTFFYGPAGARPLVGNWDGA